MSAEKRPDRFEGYKEFVDRMNQARKAEEKAARREFIDRAAMAMLASGCAPDAADTLYSEATEIWEERQRRIEEGEL